VLDRSLAEQRIFPSINIMESGTRKEELLYDKGDAAKVALLRRKLAGKKPDQMMRYLIDEIHRFPTNKKFLAGLC
jgi:transcription termination factor Rho